MQDSSSRSLSRTDSQSDRDYSDSDGVVLQATLIGDGHSAGRVLLNLDLSRSILHIWLDVKGLDTGNRERKGRAESSGSESDASGNGDIITDVSFHYSERHSDWSVETHYFYSLNLSGLAYRSVNGGKSAELGSWQSVAVSEKVIGVLIGQAVTITVSTRAHPQGVMSGPVRHADTSMLRH